MPMHIVLQGFMACGKSNLGPKLAKSLGYSFVDLDLACEKLFNTTVAGFVNAHGLAAFRYTERALLKSLLKASEPQVIALGGGTLTHQHVLNLVKKKSIVVYLNTPLPTLIKRLQKNFKTRPLINGLTPAERKIFIRALWEKRQKYYTQSHLVWTPPCPVKTLKMRIMEFKSYTASCSAENTNRFDF